MINQAKGGFTLPGESGYEALTLEMAEKWGADVIRDSDGTALSSDILNAGYDIYSTVCIIREHNEYAKEHPRESQQTFLMTPAQMAQSDIVVISLLDSFFADQFQVNEEEESLVYWQVFDRTTNRELERENWRYSPELKCVTIVKALPWHRYTVNFLAYRIWEEISMYNHTTNNWNSEHLMQLDPRHPNVQKYLRDWMENWCETHPATNVVRFTSLFYNFVWIWGSDVRNRHMFTDWASYDFTLSPLALRQFEQQYGYALTSEDFINKGKRHPCHFPADRRKCDYMEFINDFVINFGKQLVDIVHSYKKQAYMFFDDSWVGTEPCGERFKEFGFDGIIKCVFSGFEARLCSSVRGVKTHELRLHPYLFPLGLGGAPTFMKGGNPTLEAQRYWNNVRRALLRAQVDRIGLGGYLHLVQDFPEFVEYMEKVANEFRTYKTLHFKGMPYCLKPKIGVLTTWGKLRNWTCGGHYHEHPELDLINIMESLSGMPFEVEFLSFEDIKSKVHKDISVLINAGIAGSAWSGGEAWDDDKIVENITQWVAEGGVLLGVNEPSETEDYDTTFRMSNVLGVDRDHGERLCHGRWQFTQSENGISVIEKGTVEPKKDIYLTDGKAEVLLSQNGVPCVTCNIFGKGKGIYMAGYTHSMENTRMLLNLILYSTKESLTQNYLTSNYYTECAYFPLSGKLIVINNSELPQQTVVPTQEGDLLFELEPFATQIISLKK